MNDLHLKPSDAEDRSKWREMIRQGIAVTAIVMVLLWAKYELYVSDVGLQYMG